MAFKIKIFAGAIVAVQLAMGVAQAQTPAPPSAERLRLAKAVFEAQGGLTNVSAAMDRIMDSMQASIPAQTGASGTAQRDSRQIMHRVLQKYLPQMLDLEAQVYAETFDEQQLSDILAFYQSPTGQVMRDKLPELSGRSGAAIGKLMPAIMVDVLDEVCDQSVCTAAQQKTLLALKQQLAAKPAP
jgi:hypothetical protein